MTGKIGPPYARIVADIKRRIAAGELKAGDRVPSTRQLARDWNVALATAAKALNTLAQEGVVHPEPRVGTVVAAPTSPGLPAAPGMSGVSAGPTTLTPATPAPAMPLSAPGVSSAARTAPAASGEHELSRDRIVRAAIEIADAEGLPALSMRGIAAKLGTATMSLYRHVASKDDLVQLMGDAAYAEITYPTTLPDGWRARLELSARAMWELYRRHPWLPQIAALGRPMILPNLLIHAEFCLRALDGHGLPPLTMHNIHILVYNHVQGLAVHLERTTQQQVATGLTDDEWMDIQQPGLEAVADTGDYPTFTRVVQGLGPDYDFDFDAFFEFGLTPLLNGIATLVEAP